MEDLIFRAIREIPIAPTTRYGIIIGFVILELAIPKHWYK